MKRRGFMDDGVRLVTALFYADDFAILEDRSSVADGG
jgi:hypothetical protein